MSALETVAVEVEAGGRKFGSFAEAAEAGFEFSCEWFALCENAAEVALAHPVLTAVPTCGRCAAKVEALS